MVVRLIYFVLRIVIGIKLCYHSYEKWSSYTQTYERPCCVRDGNAYLNGNSFIRFTKTFQCRKCKKCGYTQQKDI